MDSKISWDAQKSKRDKGSCSKYSRQQQLTSHAKLLYVNTQQIIEGDSDLDCAKKVYEDKATATFNDR
jgi:hypothetical protein